MNFNRWYSFALTKSPFLSSTSNLLLELCEEGWVEKKAGTCNSSQLSATIVISLHCTFLSSHHVII